MNILFQTLFLSKCRANYEKRFKTREEESSEGQREESVQKHGEKESAPTLSNTEEEIIESSITLSAEQKMEGSAPGSSKNEDKKEECHAAESVDQKIKPTFSSNKKSVVS